MSPTHKFMVTLVSAGLIATIALATGILEMFYKILNLSEETRSLLQGVAVAGQILLLVAQSIERIHAGFLIIRDFQAAPEPVLDDDVSSAGEELEICVQTGPARHSPDYTILTQRHLSREESCVRTIQRQLVTHWSQAYEIRTTQQFSAKKPFLIVVSYPVWSVQFVNFFFIHHLI